MNKSRHHALSNIVRLLLLTALTIVLTVGSGQTAQAFGSPATVVLGGAAHFAVLTKTGITNVAPSKITGDLGASPIAATAITGFSLIKDSTNTFSKSAQVTGKVYAANYASPTPANMTTAISNMQTAYTDAAGRAPDATGLYAGNLSGRTLAPGVYKWSTGVLLTSNLTLAGSATDIWIFQISGNLTLSSGAKVLLSGGAQAKNIFWQVAGGVGVTIGTTAHMEGTILAAKAINLRTGASLNGRALAQTAVTLQKNTIVIASSIHIIKTQVFKSISTQDGWVLESSENSNAGGTMNSTSTALRLGDDAKNKQYRAILHFDTTLLPNTAVVTSVTLKIRRQGLVGTNPFLTHGGLKVDISNPFFGTAADLQLEDFYVSSSSKTVAIFGATPANSWYSAVVSSVGRSFVNRTGTTQFRLHFAMDDNNDHGADFMYFSSGNAVSTLRPQLIVRYYIP